MGGSLHGGWGGSCTRDGEGVPMGRKPHGRRVEVAQCIDGSLPVQCKGLAFRVDGFGLWKRPCPSFGFFFDLLG